jgi:hypothetical protein
MIPSTDSGTYTRKSAVKGAGVVTLLGAPGLLKLIV